MLVVVFMTRKEIFKIVAVVCIICASLGIFYWQTTLAKAEHVANWGMADAKEINVNSKVSGRVVEILADAARFSSPSSRKKFCIWR